MKITAIAPERKDDINLPNEPFALFGKLVPLYDGEKWDYRISYFEEGDVSEMRFPDENYDYGKLSENSEFLGAYDGDKCVGVAILQRAMFRYLYLYDLKVCAGYRGARVGTMLVDKAKQLSLERGYRGLYTQAQDNNLGACLFYLKNGFTIGGLDTKVYAGTPQEEKKDVIFYCDLIK